jgi:hypothetical protein
MLVLYAEELSAPRGLSTQRYLLFIRFARYSANFRIGALRAAFVFRGEEASPGITNKADGDFSLPGFNTAESREDQQKNISSTFSTALSQAGNITEADKLTPWL